MLSFRTFIDVPMLARPRVVWRKKHAVGGRSFLVTPHGLVVFDEASALDADGFARPIARLRLLDPATGKPRFSVDVPGNPTLYTLGDEAIAVTGGADVTIVDLRTRAIRQRPTVPGRHLADLENGLQLVSENGRFVARAWTTGDLAWAFDGDPLGMPPSASAEVVGPDRLLITAYPPTSRAIALSAATGEVIWSRTFPVEEVLGQRVDASGALLHHHRGDERGIASVGPDGELGWLSGVPWKTGSLTVAGTTAELVLAIAVASRAVAASPQWATLVREVAANEGVDLAGQAITQTTKETAFLLLERATGKVVRTVLRVPEDLGGTFAEGAWVHGGFYVPVLGVESSRRITACTWDGAEAWSFEDAWVSRRGPVQIVPTPERIYVVTSMGTLCLAE